VSVYTEGFVTGSGRTWWIQAHDQQTVGPVIYNGQDTGHSSQAEIVGINITCMPASLGEYRAVKTLWDTGESSIVVQLARLDNGNTIKQDVEGSVFPLGDDAGTAVDGRGACLAFPVPWFQLGVHALTGISIVGGPPEIQSVLVDGARKAGGTGAIRVDNEDDFGLAVGELSETDKARLRETKETAEGKDFFTVMKEVYIDDGFRDVSLG